MANHRADPATAMPTLTLAAHVDVMVCPHALAGAALSFIDVLRSANTIAALQHGDAAPRIGWRLVDAAGRPLRGLPAELRGYADARLRSERHVRRALFVPSLLARDMPSLRHTLDGLDAAVKRIATAFDEGALVVTLGAATWLAARTGRADGLRVALAWYHSGGFRQDFPQVAVSPGSAWLHDGPLLSGAEAATLIPVAIELVRLAVGPELAQACANVHQHDPDRQHAAVRAAAQAHLGTTRSSPVALAVAWMGEHLDRPYRLRDVADAAAVSPRTLLRHFQEALGHSPLDHLHGLRCQRARVLLELSLDGVPAIGEACGYADPAAFRRVFRRETGVSPAQYRQRYALRSPRVRWKVDAT